MSKVLTRPLRVLIQGKDQLGKAKYVNVTESGDLRVQLSGTLTELEQARELLEAIKANQLSGDQKVQLSGTMVELIKEYIGVPTPSGTGVRYVGEGTGGLPLNVSGYREVAITIRNQGSAETQLWGIIGYNSSANTNKSTISDDNGGQRWKIPAGARLVLNRHNTEILKNAHIGLRLTFYGATEESVVDVEFVGVK